MPKLAEFMEPSGTKYVGDDGHHQTFQRPRFGCWRFKGGFKNQEKDKNPPEKKRDKSKSQEDPQGSKKNSQKKKNKGEMNKYAY